MIAIKTKKKKEVVDITEKVQEAVDIQEGICHLFLMHTTAALTTADLDPGTDQDYLDAIEAIAPKLQYRHPHDPSHVPDHIMSSLIGASLNVPIQKGELVLGTWQRIVLIELNGPKERKVVISFHKG